MRIILSTRIGVIQMAKKSNGKKSGNIGSVFQNLMNGRYGGDNYGLFLFITGLALMIIGAVGNNIPGTILMMIATAEIVFAYVRLMSKKYDKRREENRRYLYKRNSFLGSFKIVWRTLKEGRHYKFYKCPQCAVVLRLPKGAGMIEITCPKCGKKFIKKV